MGTSEYFMDPLKWFKALVFRSIGRNCWRDFSVRGPWFSTYRILKQNPHKWVPFNYNNAMFRFSYISIKIDDICLLFLQTCSRKKISFRITNKWKWIRVRLVFLSFVMTITSCTNIARDKLWKNPVNLLAFLSINKWNKKQILHWLAFLLGLLDTDISNNGIDDFNGAWKYRFIVKRKPCWVTNLTVFQFSKRNIQI